ERKLAEEALRRNEERFRNQYQSFPLPTFTWLQVGDDFVLQDYNDAADTSTGGIIRRDVENRASQWYEHQPAILGHLRTCVSDQQTLKREMRYRYRTTGLERELSI